MIRLEAFLEDKQAGKVLHALTGLVIHLKLMPVRNAKVQKGKVVEAGEPITGKDFIRAFIAQCAKAGKDSFKRIELVRAAEENGLSRKAISTALIVLHKAKEVKRKPKAKGMYLVPKESE